MKQLRTIAALYLCASCLFAFKPGSSHPTTNKSSFKYAQFMRSLWLDARTPAREIVPRLSINFSLVIYNSADAGLQVDAVGIGDMSNVQYLGNQYMPGSTGTLNFTIDPAGDYTTVYLLTHAVSSPWPSGSSAYIHLETQSTSHCKYNVNGWLQIDDVWANTDGSLLINTDYCDQN